jgi:hypothetical protein
LRIKSIGAKPHTSAEAITPEQNLKYHFFFVYLSGFFLYIMVSIKRKITIVTTAPYQIPVGRWSENGEKIITRKVAINSMAKSDR